MHVDGKFLQRIRIIRAGDLCVCHDHSTSSRLATLMARNAAETGAQGAVKQGLGWPQSLVGRVVRGVEGRTGALTIPAPPPVVA